MSLRFLRALFSPRGSESVNPIALPQQSVGRPPVETGHVVTVNILGLDGVRQARWAVGRELPLAVAQHHLDEQTGQLHILEFAEAGQMRSVACPRAHWLKAAETFKRLDPPELPLMQDEDADEDAVAAGAAGTTRSESSRPAATRPSEEPLSAEQWIERRDAAIATRESMRATGGFLSLKREVTDPELAPEDIREDVICILRARARDATSSESSSRAPAQPSGEPLTAEQWVKRRDVAIATRRSMHAEGAFMSLKQEVTNPELAPPAIRDDVMRLLRARDERSVP